MFCPGQYLIPHSRWGPVFPLILLWQNFLMSTLVSLSCVYPPESNIRLLWWCYLLVTQDVANPAQSSLASLTMMSSWLHFSLNQAVGCTKSIEWFTCSSALRVMLKTISLLLPIFVKKSICRDQNWFLCFVPWIQTGLNWKEKFVKLGPQN